MDLIEKYLGLMRIEGISSSYFKNILLYNDPDNSPFRLITDNLDKDSVMYLYDQSGKRQNIKCIKHYYMRQTGHNASKLEKCYDIQMNLNGTYARHMRCDHCHLNALSLFDEGKLIPLEVNNKRRKRSKNMIDSSIFE